MNAALIARNRVVSVFGLETPTDAEILHIQHKTQVRVGEKIGPWPVFFVGDDELIAGRDNTHMDFRLSILKMRDGGHESVVVSTLCMVKNAFGRGYLTSIIPFHKLGLRALIANAVAAGRL